MLTISHDRQSYINDNANFITDDNLAQIITKVVNKKNNCRSPPRFLCNIGQVNFPTKLDTKVICTLKTDMNKLFKAAKKVTAVPDTPDAVMI